MSKGSKFALGAVIGAAAGVVAGMLTAPKSGKDTRTDLKRKADELKTDANATAEKVKAKTAKTAEEVKARADKVATDAKATVNDYRGRVERASDSAKKEFKNVADNLLSPIAVPIYLYCSRKQG